MEEIISHVETLRASVQKYAAGRKCDQLLLLLTQFEERLLEPTDASLKISEDGLLLTPKAEVNDISVNVEDPLEGDHATTTVNLNFSDWVPAENSAGEMTCKLCEINGRPGNCLSSLAVDGAKAKSYKDWGQLTDHIQEVHSVFNNRLVEKDGYAVNGKRLFDKAGVAVSKVSVLAKYSAIACPRCDSLISLGASFKNGYTKLCYHLFIKHQETLSTYISIHQCSLCTYSSYSGTLLSRHVEYNHSGRKNKNNQKVSCPVCKKLVLQRFLARHMAVSHRVGSHSQTPAEKLNCHICSKEIRGKTNLARHIQRMHSKTREFLCQWCSSLFYERKQLINHMFIKHKANPYDKPVIHCQESGCDFASLTNDSVLKHFATCHETIKPYTCTQCGKSFKTRHNLHQHVNVMHASGEKYECTQCSFTSHVQQYMKRHMKIHSLTKKHRCTFPGCSYASHFSENVKKHSKVHSWQHKAGTNAKRDHSYVRRTRTSKKRVAMETTNTDTTNEMMTCDKQSLSTADVESFGADVDICSEERLSNWTVDGKLGIHDKEHINIQNTTALHSMAGEDNSQPLYACQQQYEDNNYISL